MVKFKPQLIPTIALIVFLPIFGVLSNWQYQKAINQEKIQEYQIANQNKFRSTLPEILDSNSNQIQYSNFRLKGQFTNLTFLLDNQINQNQAGYHLFNLFETKNKQMVLLNRGWLPQGKTREDLPVYNIPIGTIEVEGYLFPIKNIDLADKYKPAIKDKVWQIIDVNKISQYYKKNIYPMQLRLTNNPGLLKTDQDPVSFNFEKKPRADRIIMHKSYAGQWLLFALTAIGLWLFYSIKRIN